MLLGFDLRGDRALEVALGEAHVVLGLLAQRRRDALLALGLLELLTRDSDARLSAGRFGCEVTAEGAGVEAVADRAGDARRDVRHWRPPLASARVRSAWYH